MIAGRRSTAHSLSLVIAGLCLLLPSAASAMGPAPPPPPPIDASGDDLFLIQASVSPNVILVMDNSEEMTHIEWHPAFDLEKVPDASYCSISADFPLLDPDRVERINGPSNMFNVSCVSPARTTSFSRRAPRLPPTNRTIGVRSSNPSNRRPAAASPFNSSSRTGVPV